MRGLSTPRKIAWAANPVARNLRTPWTAHSVQEPRHFLSSPSSQVQSMPRFFPLHCEQGSASAQPTPIGRSESRPQQNVVGLAFQVSWLSRTTSLATSRQMVGTSLRCGLVRALGHHSSQPFQLRKRMLSNSHCCMGPRGAYHWQEHCSIPGRKRKQSGTWPSHLTRQLRR